MTNAEILKALEQRSAKHHAEARQSLTETARQANSLDPGQGRRSALAAVEAVAAESFADGYARALFDLANLLKDYGKQS